MRKIVVLLLVVFFCSSTNAGMIYVPTNSTDNVKFGTSSLIAPSSSVTSVVKTKKMSKGKLYMKILESKFAKLKHKGKSAGDKSKVAAILLALFLGNLGIHDFYLGNKKAGFLKLGISLIGIALIIVGVATLAATSTVTIPVLSIIGYILLLGVSIWALVDLIRIITGSYQPVDGSFSD